MYFVVIVGPPTCNDPCILSKSFNDFLLLFLTTYKYFVINVGPPTFECPMTHEEIECKLNQKSYVKLRFNKLYVF